MNLLDLPNEILILILKKLNNIDVLYSLFNIDNERLNMLAQEENFSNTLDFLSIDKTSLIDQRKLDRFYVDILPIIHQNVRCLVVEPMLMERLFLAGDYPNLTELQIFNFEENIALSYFTDESPLRHVFQKQITSLCLGNRDMITTIGSSKHYTINVYAHILNFFKNLKSFTIIERLNPLYPRLSIRHHPSTFFCSSTLTYLCINTNTLDDCLYLLDGRLKQLSTFIVDIGVVDESSSIIHNMDDLPNLKYFSLKSYLRNNRYDDKIVPLLRRMSCLQKLTLYLRIRNRSTFIGSIHLENEILPSMLQLHSFNFYISTYDNTVHVCNNVPVQKLQRLAITHIGQQPVANLINYANEREAVCHTFSLPFLFDRLEDIGNVYPDTIFSYVTHLLVQDMYPFNHEFFVRLARSFPSLTCLRVINLRSQSACNLNRVLSDSSQSYSIARYSRLTSLDVQLTSSDYVEQFLNETKTHLPHLTELKVYFHQLINVTNNFTRKDTRLNCMKVKRLVTIGAWVNPKDFYLYFPCL